MRKGRRVTTPNAVLYFAPRSAGEDSRFGFVVTKAVGGSVTRNLMRRRLRAVANEAVVTGSTATDVVVRPLPGSEKLDWVTLHQEILQAIEKGTRR